MKNRRTPLPKHGTIVADTAHTMQERPSNPGEPGPASPQRIKAHENRSGTTVHGGSAILFGLPFVGAGVFIILAATNVIPTKDASFGAPRALVAACGLVFVLPGLWLMLHGVRGILQRRRAAQRLATDFTQPWLADHDWNPAGERDRFGRKLANHAFGFLIVALLCAPPNFIAIYGGANKSGWLYALACVNVFPLMYAIALVHVALRWARFGTGRVRFRRFPYEPGSKLEVDFLPGRKLEGIEKMTCTLRCIQEAYERKQVNGKTQTTIVSYELHRQVRELDATGLGRFPGESLSMDFDLPPDPALTTCLAEAPPRYWELELSSAMPGVDFRSVFLVPVYAVGQSRQDEARASNAPRPAEIRELQAVS